MTAQWYNDNGYKVSTLLAQSEIDRAEADVTAAYIAPIVGGATVDEDVKKRAVAQLASLLLLQRSVFATRAGAKIKTGYNSRESDAWEQLQQEATCCHLALQTLRLQSGVNANAVVTDICKIYFSTNFLYTN